MTETRTSPPAKLDRSGKGRIATVLGALLLFGVILFSASGRLDWPEAWIFLALYLVGTLFPGLWVLRHNPEVINERGRIGKNAKSWDKVIAVFYLIFLLGGYVVAGLDARFAWSAVPLWTKFLGGIALAISLFLSIWAMMANTFLSTLVRIQDERGHTTVTEGPYRFVRHPMYAGSLFMSFGVPLLLGSWWALVPGVLLILVIVVRTVLEDKTLQAELMGYKDYVRKVHYRLIPGVW